MEKLENCLFEDIFDKENEFSRENLSTKNVRNARISRGRFYDTKESQLYKQKSLERDLP